MFFKSISDTCQFLHPVLFIPDPPKHNCRAFNREDSLTQLPDSSQESLSNSLALEPDTTDYSGIDYLSRDAPSGIAAQVLEDAAPLGILVESSQNDSVGISRVAWSLPRDPGGESHGWDRLRFIASLSVRQLFHGS